MRRPKWMDFREVRRWLTLRCGHCGHRFRWKRDPRSSYGNGPVFHTPCIAYLNWRRMADERLAVIDSMCELSGLTGSDVKGAASLRGTDESNRAWRVFYDLDRSKEGSHS